MLGGRSISEYASQCALHVSVQLCFICIHVCPQTNLHKHASHVSVYMYPTCAKCVQVSVPYG